MSKIITIGKIKVGGKNPFLLIAGPCVIEDEKTVMTTAEEVKKITQRLRIPYVFKASFDKANRTSIDSYRGPGLEKGLKILAKVKKEVGVPVLSDIHSIEQIDPAAEVLDILQIPAFLCRQTDLLVKAGNSKRVINVKKGQFLAPEDMKQVVKKIESTGNKRILLTDRGTSFGYNNLVSDFRSIAIMQETGYPVVFDATHSVQQPGGLGNASGGRSEFIPLLARCGIAAGADAVFMEVHPNPKKAKSDGPNSLALKSLEEVLKTLRDINKIVK